MEACGAHRGGSAFREISTSFKPADLHREASLQGRDRELNEQLIGERVFDRSIGYDPRDDNIVRAHASASMRIFAKRAARSRCGSRSRAAVTCRNSNTSREPFLQSLMPRHRLKWSRKNRSFLLRKNNQPSAAFLSRASIYSLCFWLSSCPPRSGYGRRGTTLSPEQRVPLISCGRQSSAAIGIR
jgi:hypothetical protein